MDLPPASCCLRRQPARGLDVAAAPPWRSRMVRSARLSVFALAAAALCAGVAAGTGPSWPLDRDGLVLAWLSADRPAEVVDPATAKRGVLRVEARGTARFGRFFEMDTRGGSFEAQGAGDALVAACRKTGQVTIEIVLTPDAAPQPGCTQVAALAPDKGPPDLVLAQEGDALVFGLRTSGQTGDAPAETVRLGKVEALRPLHLVVSYAPGRLAWSMDGEPQPAAPAPAGDLANWAPGRLVFGGEGPPAWRGRIEGVAVYSRTVGPDEARARFALAAARLKDRRPAARLSVDARLVAATPVPDPKTIAPYVRALVVNEYEIDRVVEGRYDGKRVAVAQWAILGGAVLPADWKVGEPRRLVLERFEDHPELESERLIMGGAGPALPLFLDVGR